MTDHDREYSIATPGQMARFGITENFDADRNDPRNADYLRPLGNPKAEDLASAFADGAYCGIAYDRGGFDSPEESDLCFEQCLINGRKYECEPEYRVLFGDMGDDDETSLQPKGTLH
jgi:hypothetical protein